MIDLSLGATDRPDRGFVPLVKVQICSTAQETVPSQQVVSESDFGSDTFGYSKRSDHD
jgi:hypothetical protein